MIHVSGLTKNFGSVRALDRVSFDVPERGMVRISLGTEEFVAPILNEYATYKTVAYTFGGVSYMDTVFFELGKVFSSEHKDLFNAVIATTWRFDCVIER